MQLIRHPETRYYERLPIPRWGIWRSSCAGSRRSRLQRSFKSGLFTDIPHVEAELAANVLHGPVLLQNVAVDARDALAPRYPNQQIEQFLSHAGVLPRVAH